MWRVSARCRPTVITAPELFNELFALFGKRRQDYIEFIELDLWYRFRFHDGSTFDYGGTLEHTGRDWKNSTRDTTGYKQLLKRQSHLSGGFEQLADKPFHQLSSLPRCIPSMLRLRSDRSVWQLVSRYLTSDKLRQAFSMQPLLVGGNPFDTTSIYNLSITSNAKTAFTLLKAATLVDALTQLMLDVGINIRLQETVTSIRVNKNQNVTGISMIKINVLAAMLLSQIPTPVIYMLICYPPIASRKALKKNDNNVSGRWACLCFFLEPKNNIPLLHTIPSL